jgi:DNA replication factor GINS
VDLFQSLRKIQKKERDNGTLAQVEEDFYSQIHTYLNDLKQSAIDDPFSDVYNTLNEARRIATEICEKREHKITQAAVLNINRSYNLFSGEQEFDLVDSMPLNLTPEEETFYFALIDTLKTHKLSLSGVEAPKAQIPRETVIESPLDDKEDVDSTPDEEEIPKKEVSKEEVKTTSNSLGDIADMAMGTPKKDEVLDRIDEISKAKVITDEVREPIEKQISKPKTKKELPKEFGDIEILDNDAQFIDLDDPKRSRESDIVTILVLDEIDSIMGIDEKVYGPFRSQDIVTLPKINANIFVKNRKARFVKI